MKRPTSHSIAGLLAAGVLLAGCGGSSPSESPNSSGATGSSNASQFQKHFVDFATCMRSHGVPDYPDPQFTSSGGVQISPGKSNPNSPAFKSAQTDCRRLLPDGGQPVGVGGARAKVQEVKFADCMRAHGVPNFPDPSHDGAFDLPPGLNPQAPRFGQATQACKSVQPSSLSVNQSAGT
jgi:hypothetical protein